MSPALELLVQFVGAISNPFVIGASLLTPFLWPRPAAVRLCPTLTAGGFGLVDAALSTGVMWGVLLVCVSMAGGAVVGQAAVLVFVPLMLAMIRAVRAIVVRLRGP